LRRSLLLISLMFLALCAYADDGMWLFNAPPAAQIKAKYGFELTPAWLDHVQLSSVRFNNGGSGSFVSADGLTFTNHHVGATCLQQLSTADKDYIKAGFSAKSRAEEAKCPDLELNVLQGIQDVTDKVRAAVKPGVSVAESGQAQRAAMSGIEKDCAATTGLRCDVVTLYAGGMYHLYKYKKYTDVRLVFAPEFLAAFFGGDPDNFEYPRYDLDITFFRIYENDKPVQLQHYLKWSSAGVKENDLVFVSGHPGGTDRQRTVAELEFQRDVSLPYVVPLLQSRIASLKAFAAQSPENARIAQRQIFSLENSYKAINGEWQGLKKPEILKRKLADEQKLRAAVEANPNLKAETGNAWNDVAQALKVEKEIYLPYVLLEARSRYQGALDSRARTLVRVVEEKKKPNGERLREYRDSALPSLEQSLFSTAPIYKSLETLHLTDWLTALNKNLPNDPAVQKVLGGKSPAEVAKQVVAATKFDDVAVRRQLYQGGAAAVEASTDPMIVLMRAIDPEARLLRKRHDDEIDAVERSAGGKIARARFALEGTSTPPDATFTLRLSYGPATGYVDDGLGIVPKGTKLPYFTAFAGAFDHAAAHGNKDPYELPPSWMNAKQKMKLNTPLNFVHTSDTVGGNSGSPTVNTKGEVVGIIFDGNIQTLVWNYVYDDKTARAVSVDSRGIEEALRNVYGASALLDELKAGKAAGASAR
jgi:Peptidase S46